MKTKLLLMLMFLLTVGARGQSFMNLHGTTGTDQFRHIELFPNGDYAVVGEVGTPTDNTDIYVARLNAQGDVIWERVYGDVGSEVGYYVIVDPTTSNLVVCGATINATGSRESLVMEFTGTGNLVWARTYGTAPLADHASSVTFSNNRTNILVAGYDNNPTGPYPDMLLFEINRNTGEIIWQNRIATASQGDAIFKIYDAVNGEGYVALGGTHRSGLRWDGVLMTLSATGQLTNRVTYGTTGLDQGRDLLQLADGSLIVLSQAVFDNEDVAITAFSADLTRQWEKIYGSAATNGKDRPWKLIPVPGGYAIAGETDGTGAGSDDAFLLTVDTEGNMTDFGTYGNTAAESAWGVVRNNDGTYTLAGLGASGSNGGADGMLLRTDADLNVPNNCSNGSFIEKARVTTTHTNVAYTQASPNLQLAVLDWAPKNINVNMLTFGLSIEGEEAVCLGGQATFTANTTMAVQWTFSANATEVSRSGNSITLQFPNLGEVEITATAGTCKKTHNVTVESADVNIIGLNDKYCRGDYDIALTAEPAGGFFSVNGKPTYEFVPSAAGTYEIAYTYTSPSGCIGSETRTVIVEECCQYKIGEVSGICGDLSTNICVPLIAKYPVSRGIVGLDYCLEYDATAMRPIGYKLGNVVHQGVTANASAYMNTDEPGRVRTTIHFSSNAPEDLQFKGEGEVICIYFRLLDGAEGNKTYPLTACELDEALTVSERPACWEAGSISVQFDPMLRGRLIYQGGLNNNLGMNYTVTDPNMAVTEISGTDKECNNVTPAVMPNASGSFSVNVSGAEKIKITRDIKPNLPNATHARLRHINGLDTYVMRYMATMKNSGFFGQTPTPYQMIAADVNMSGKVRANDITLVQQRIVRKIDEYPQVWNQGTNELSLDWRFIDRNTVLTDPAFTVSSTYPNDDAVGYYRDRVPSVPFCLPFDMQCRNEAEQIYSGILLGDAYASYTNDSYMKIAAGQSVTEVSFEVDDVTEISENVYRVAVKHNFVSEEPLVAMDLVLDYDESLVAFEDLQQTLEATNAGAVVEWNDYNNTEIILTSFTEGQYPAQGNLFYIDLRKESGTIASGDFTVSALLNGAEVTSEILFHSDVVTGTADALAQHINVMPNPASDNAMITFKSVSADQINVQMLNSLGQVVNVYKNVDSHKGLSVNVADLAKGVYYCVIDVDGKSIVKKLVVTK